MIDDLERRIRMTGLGINEFCRRANVTYGMLYDWRRGRYEGRPDVVAHVQAVLEQLERERLAELLDRYQQKGHDQDASQRR